MRNAKKPAHLKCVRINITLPPVLLDASTGVFRKHGFAGLSDYVQARLRKDAGLDLVTP